MNPVLWQWQSAGLQDTISNLSPSTTYHYRSVGFNCCAEGIGADTSFTTAWAPVPPTLVSPGTTTDTGFFASGLSPLFSWTGFSQASSYDLIISQSPYGLANIVFTGSAGGTSYQLPGNILQSGTKYAWYMVSFNGTGDAGTLRHRHFTFRRPPAWF